MPTSTPYPKSFSTPAEHLALFRSRGLIITDEAQVRHYLQFIGYYRLSGYARPFQTGPDHRFRNGTSFEHILDLYIFDRKLRLLLLDAIERIEIALRTVINDTLARRLGTHWYLDLRAFMPYMDHAQLMRKLQDEMGYNDPRKQETFIAHYFNTYTTPPFPPCWMVFETLAIGTVSKIYKDLAVEHRKQIARVFAIQHEVLASAFHALSYLRNLCAHHNRVWNRTFRIKPIFPKVLHNVYGGPNDRVGALVAIIELLLSRIAPDSDWRAKFDQLLQEHPEVDRPSMGYA